MDLTDKKLKDLLQERTQELNKNLNLMETIFSSMPGLMYIFEQTATGNFELLRWNKELEQTTGYNHCELKGLSIFKFIHEKHHNSIKQRLELMLKGEVNNTPTEYLLEHKDGSEIPFLTSPYSTTFEGQKFVVGIGLDIREKKQTEKRFSRLAAAIEHAAEEVIITDAEGNIEYVNPAFENTSGYCSAEILGKNPRILKSDSHDKSFYDNLWAKISSGNVWQGRFINRKKDGSRFTEEAVISPVYDEAGNLDGYVSLKRDITLQLKLEEHVRQAQKMDSIATLAGGIAHDFNNILTSIISSNELAMMKIEDNPAAMKSLKRIDAASFRARDLVQQISTFSQPHRDGKISMQPATVIDEALKLLRSSIPATIEIRSEITTKGIIKGDPTQIHQIIMNLCTNAFHAMRDNGGIIAVSLSEIRVTAGDPLTGVDLEPGKHLRLEVSDTGTGMDEQTKKKIFEPYFTSKTAGEGTGLGLAVVHGIVKGHLGQINVYSEPGKGSTFNIYLPIVADTVTPVAVSVAEKATIKYGCERILFVDDEEPLLQIAEEIFSKHGYLIKTFSNPTLALDHFAEQPNAYDLVVTDMTMPSMDGSELAQKMMALKPDFPVILCTGYSEIINRKKSLEIGIRHYCQKPIVMSKLLEEVRKIFDKKRCLD